jgi:hypothetical protein
VSYEHSDLAGLYGLSATAVPSIGVAARAAIAGGRLKLDAGSYPWWTDLVER